MITFEVRVPITTHTVASETFGRELNVFAECAGSDVLLGTIWFDHSRWATSQDDTTWPHAKDAIEYLLMRALMRAEVQ